MVKRLTLTLIILGLFAGDAMATRIYLNRRSVASASYDSYYLMSTAQLTGSTSALIISRTVSLSSTLREFLHLNTIVPQETWIGWRTPRVSSQVTISGTLTFNLWGMQTTGTIQSGKFRVRLVKRTSGGGDVDTFIAEGDASGNLVISATTPTVHNFTLTPAAPVTIGPGERLLLRVYLVNVGSEFDTATFRLYFDSGVAAANGQSWFDTTETVAFDADLTTFYHHRTTGTGIGIFQDLLTSRGGSAATTAVVNTVASGTEIQFTGTAGGPLLEFISPRFSGPWEFVDTEQIGTFRVYVRESATSANIALRKKVFRRAADGTETLIWSRSIASEMGTTAGAVISSAGSSGVLDNAAFFAEDDRIVIRFYIIPAGAQTMDGGQTSTLSYDHNTTGTGDTIIEFYDATTLKAEADPARSQIVPSGTSMSGMGNGQ